MIGHAEHERSRPIGNAASDEAGRPLAGEALAIGTELDGRFRVVRSLGRGGMGQVYEATDMRLGRRVAVKVLRPASGASADLRKRFAREAKAVAQIQHEHVVTVFDYGIGPSDEPYLVMEYLAGQDLRSLLQQQGQVAAPRAVRLIHDGCSGLAAAHARGVIHRDLKPENLFVVTRGRHSELCKVLDFGLAKLRTTDGSDLQTRAGVPFGTLHYMSPEQARGDADVDERTDVYSAAAVLYEMLSGERLHSADSPHALLYKIIHEAPARLEQKCAYLPPGLADVVHQGLATDPALRPASIEAFAGSLEPFMRPPVLRAAPKPGFGAARGRLETLPERALEKASNHSSRTPRQRRNQAPLLAACLLVGMGVFWLVQSPAVLPDAAAAKARTKAPSLPSAFREVALGAASALTIAASASEKTDDRTARETAIPRQARRPQAPAASAAVPAPTNAPVKGVEVGFDRQNPYAASTEPAR